MTRLLLMGILAMMALVSIHAQEREINGVVTDAETGEPLIGVNVSVEGTTVGTITSADGTYTLNASSGTNLVFSYIGYLTVTEAVGNRTEISIVMNLSTEELD